MVPANQGAHVLDGTLFRKCLRYFHLTSSIQRQLIPETKNGSLSGLSHDLWRLKMQLNTDVTSQISLAFHNLFSFRPLWSRQKLIYACALR